jgi:DNA mismatch repair protein MutS2
LAPRDNIDFTVEMSVDLHGLRPSDALLKLDRHLRRCHAAGLLLAHVIHGRGAGTLRAAVREHLAKHPLVARFRDGSYGIGGDGVTVVELKRPH